MERVVLVIHHQYLLHKELLVELFQVQLLVRHLMVAEVVEQLMQAMVQIVMVLVRLVVMEPQQVLQEVQ